MTRSIRSAVFACASLSALALAGSALAAYTPSLEVTPGSLATAGGGATTVRVAQMQTDDPTAALTIYIPLGYTATLNQPVGATIGQVTDARITIGALGGALARATGTLLVADPARFAAESLACTRTSTHTAVWTFNLTTETGTAVQPIPIFVDQITAGPEATFAGYKIQVCFRSPDVPEAEGGAPLGTKFVEATFTLTNLTNPVSRGAYPWRAVWTPYTPGTATPNVAGTVETRAEVRLPLILLLSASHNRTTQVITLSGSVVENGQPVPGIMVQILRGTTETNVARFTTARTDANGQYRVTVRAVAGARSVFFRARAGSRPRQNPGGCTAAPVLPGIRCTNATAQGFDVQNRAVVEVTLGPTGTGKGTRCENTERGTARRDTLRGTFVNDCFFGLGGNDRLIGGSGNDRLNGGAGNDLTTGDVGNDRLDGGAGNDLLTGGIGRDTLLGFAGSDVLDGGIGDDRLAGGPGVDRFVGGLGNDEINALDRRNETVTCGPGRDTVRADRGDRLLGCERVSPPRPKEEEEEEE